ncbi:MAG: hypothetical protein HY717_20490 [Planctomycetes bacterium]|nr:hypothetical protein [Planctomycetota bacterium]
MHRFQSFRGSRSPFQLLWGLGLFLGWTLSLAHESANLRSPDGQDRPRGEARIGDDGSEIRIRGDDFAPALELSIWIADAGGTLAEAARTKTRSNGSFEFRQSVAAPLDFAGRSVEVRGPDGTALLVGSFPKAAREDELGVGSGKLTPPAGSAFPGASGRIRAKAKEGRHLLEVKVRDLSDDAAFKVCLVDAAGNVEVIGAITTSGGGNGALKIDSGDGGALPFGAAGIADLIGFAVQVKSEDGAAVLSGKVPALGENENEVGEEAEVEFDLARPENPPEAMIAGDVNLQSESEAGRDRTRVRIDEATPGAEYAVTFHRPSSDPAQEPQRELFAKLTADGDGRAEHEARGDGFPLGASSIADLGGAVVEIRDAAGALVLSGTVPQIGNPPVEPPQVEELELEVRLSRPDPAPLPEAHGKVEFEEEEDEHEIEVEIEDLKAGETYRVELRDGAGNAEALAEGPADAEGNLRKKTLFLGAERLPFGAASFKAYDGFAIAVLDAGGATVLSGMVALPSGSGGALPAEISFRTVGAYDAAFLRGDSDRSFTIDISDPIITLEALFLGTPQPVCQDAMDANDDGGLDISDAVFTLLHLFRGLHQIPYPGTSVPGFDPTPDLLFCEDR